MQIMLLVFSAFIDVTIVDLMIIDHEALLLSYNDNITFSHSEVCFTVKDKLSSMGCLQWG